MQNEVRRFWRSAMPPLAGGVAVGMVTLIGHYQHLSLTITALLYLILILLVSTRAGLAGSLAISALAAMSLQVAFTVPLNLDPIVLLAFGLTAVVVATLASTARRSLRQVQAIRNELRLAIDSIPVLAWSNLPDGTVDFINRGWLEYTGLTAEDAQGDGWTRIFPPGEAARVLALREAGTASGKPYQVEGPMRRADGEYRWVLRRVVPLLDAEGKVVKWYGTGTDIEDLKRSEGALQRSQAYLDEAQRLSHTGSFGWDPSRAELRWSGETFRIFEYDAATLTPTVELVLQRVHPDDLDRVHQAIDDAIRTGADWDLDHRLLMPDCRVKHVHVVAHATHQPSGELEFVGAVMDMTAVRAAQAELERSEAYLAQAERLSHTGSWALRLADPYDDELPEQRYWSAEGYRIFQVDPATDPHPDKTMRERVHPDDWDKLVDAARRAIRERSNFEVDYRAVLPDGSVRYISAVGGPVVKAGGDVVELVGTVIDVTERKQAARAVRRAQERALTARFNAVLEERTRLAREIHDTLLQGFTGVSLQLVAVAQRVAGPAETVAAFQELIALAQRTLVDARHAVWDLRAPSLVEGDFPSRLRSLAEEALRGSGVGLSHEVTGVPRPLDPAIEAALERGLLEALANTVKHGNARAVRVELKYGKRGLRLRAVDDGCGFRVDSDFHSYGSHWGLLGMKERADRLCGTLVVDSSPGAGTTIVLRFPYHCPTALPPVVAPAPA